MPAASAYSPQKVLFGMDLFWSLFFAIILVLLFACVWWYASMPSNLPPGPIGFPFFGTMFSTRRASNLHRKLHSWTKIYGPLYKFYVAEKLVVVLGDWDTIQEALVKQGDAYAGRPQLHMLRPEDIERESGIMNSEGELWKVQRRFAIATLRDFGFGLPLIEPRIKHEIEHVIEAIELQNRKPFDPTPLLTAAISNVICALVFGRRFEYDDETFPEIVRTHRASLTENAVSYLSPFVLSSIMAKLFSRSRKARGLVKPANAISGFARKGIAETMRDFDPSRDQPTNYIQAFYKSRQERGNPWTFADNQLLASVRDLLVAGTAGSATTLRWGIFYLAHNPEWQDKIFDEIRALAGEEGALLDYADRTKLPLTEAVIMETQRMADVVPMGVQRRTVRKTKLCGYDIPENTVVVPLLTAALRDPKVYPNPEKFDPNRFLLGAKASEKEPRETRMIPFSVGKRNCLGESLARMELFFFFTALFGNFKFSFSPDEPTPAMDAEQVSTNRSPPAFKISAVRRSDQGRMRESQRNC